MGPAVAMAGTNSTPLRSTSTQFVVERVVPDFFLLRAMLPRGTRLAVCEPVPSENRVLFPRNHDKHQI